MITNDEIKLLNKLYEPLYFKNLSLLKLLLSKKLKLEHGFYNGHYRKIEDDNYQFEYFPILVLSIINICDIGINFENIWISTKLKKEASLKFDFNRLKKYNFEIHGVEDYLFDIFNSSILFEDIKKNIINSKEAEIGFSFTFDFKTENEELIKFINFLIKEKFYY